MIAKSFRGDQEKKLRGERRERERKCGRSFPINADKEIRRRGRKRIGAYLYSRKVVVGVISSAL